MRVSSVLLLLNNVVVLVLHVVAFSQFLYTFYSTAD